MSATEARLPHTLSMLFHDVVALRTPADRGWRLGPWQLRFLDHGGGKVAGFVKVNRTGLIEFVPRTSSLQLKLKRTPLKEEGDPPPPEVGQVLALAPNGTYDHTRRFTVSHLDSSHVYFTSGHAVSFEAWSDCVLRIYGPDSDVAIWERPA